MKCTDQEFIAVWNKLGSASQVSKATGISVRNVNDRRRKLENKYGIILAGISPNSPDFKVTYPDNNVRTKVELSDGVVIVASDCHYWPDYVTTGHRALVNIIKRLKPQMLITNCVAWEGSRRSRHAQSNWT